MGRSKWAGLGSYPDPIEEYASKLKDDILGFDSFSGYNRDSMPTSTYRALLRSIRALCDKILREPTPTQLHESVENIRMLIQAVRTKATKTYDSVQEVQKTTTSINSTGTINMAIFWANQVPLPAT